MGERLVLGDVRWWLAAGVDPRPVAAGLARAIDQLDRGELANRKSGRRKELYAVHLGGGAGGAALLKVNRYRGVDAWRRAFGHSKARRELARAQAVSARGIETPVPLAAGERRRAGRLMACFLVVPYLADAVDLRRWVASGPRPGERRALARAFGRFTRRICDAGVFQDDFAPNNFLLRRGPGPELLMIDFERARLRARVDRAARAFVLAKIDRELPRASRGDRLRFLLGFAEGNRSAAREWWARVEADSARRARRDLRRLRRTATRDGRRTRRLEERGWRGFALRRADPVSLATARDIGPDAGPPALAGGLWRVPLAGVRGRAAANAWAMARLLAARQLMPEPLALWWRPAGAVLLLESPPGARPFPDQRADPAARAAIRALLRQLRRLGEAAVGTDAVGAEAIVLVPVPGGPPRAQLLDPRALRVRGRPDPGGGAGLVAWARRLGAQA